MMLKLRDRLVLWLFGPELTQPVLFPSTMTEDHIRAQAKAFGLYGEARTRRDHIRKAAPWLHIPDSKYCPELETSRYEELNDPDYDPEG